MFALGSVDWLGFRFCNSDAFRKRVWLGLHAHSRLSCRTMESEANEVLERLALDIHAMQPKGERALQNQQVRS